MIQRVQTLYLFGAIVMLVIASFWGDFFDVITNEAIFRFNAFGVSQYTVDGNELISQNSMPLYIPTLVLALFSVFVVFSYKKLGTQLKYAKLLWGLFILLLGGIILWYYVFAPKQISGEIAQQNYGASFFVLVIGLGLTHLAFLSIRKDKRTIDSLNRLR